MEEHVIVDSSFSAIINASLEQIDIPSWCFSLPDDEYQGCSPAQFAAGSTTAHDGRRMSVNAEVIGGTPMVQHYVEQVADRHHLVLDSVSDLFTQNRLCLWRKKPLSRISSNLKGSTKQFGRTQAIDLLASGSCAASTRDLGYGNMLGDQER
jgi:hypothetical protein